MTLGRHLSRIKVGRRSGHATPFLGLNHRRYLNAFVSNMVSDFFLFETSSGGENVRLCHTREPWVLESS
jgi:hypothetical protein